MESLEQHGSSEDYESSEEYGKKDVATTEHTTAKTITMVDGRMERHKLTYINPTLNYTDILAGIRLRDSRCRHLPSAWSDDADQTGIYRGSLISTIIEMSDNEFPPNIFYHFCKMRYLTAEYQHLKRIEAKDFENAAALYRLDLTGNDIERIEANVFQHATNLSVINLPNNKIEFVDEQAFNYTQFRRIDFSDNKIMAWKWQPFDARLYQFTMNNNFTYQISAIGIPEWSIIPKPFKLIASNNPLVNSSDSIHVKAHEVDIQNNTLKWVIIYPLTTKLNAQNNSVSQIILEEDGNEFNMTVLNLSNNQWWNYRS